MDPVTLLNNNGYNTGRYKLVFNILRKKIFNTSSKKFILKAISSSRTELRIIAKEISNAELKRASQRFINEISNSPFLRDFILNFGNNNIVLGINIIFNNIPTTNELIIKLSEPLPSNISLLDSFSIAEEITSPLIINQDLGIPEFLDDSISLKGPNFKIDTRINNSIPSGYKNYDTALEYSLTSSYQNLLNKLENKEIPEIQYDFIRTVSSSDEVAYNFENFVHFGSALERLKNFKYKVELLEQYDNTLSTINSIEGATSSSTFVLKDKESTTTKKTNLLKGLDGYERFLYYESGALSWPKSTTSSPHTLYSLTSSQVKTWLGDERDTFSNYGGQLLSASQFDNLNEHSLIRLIPNHIIENPNNDFYVTFVNMMGHHYDQIWSHIKHITEVNDTHHSRGVSKDLVYYSLKSLGLETFDQFENANLIEYILGEGSQGSAFYDVPVSQSLVTASNAGSIPKEDITKEIWKRLYHNAPYLLKTKGTERGLKALMSCYGVPSTILNVKEYGGSTKDRTTYKTFSYEKSGLALKGDSGTDGYFIKTDWSTSHHKKSTTKTVEFRIKPNRSNNNYHLWSLSGSHGSDNIQDQHIILEPWTGNDISSSGDANQYGRLTFSRNNNTETTSTQYFPIYNGDFWNIFVGIGEFTNELDKKGLQFGAYQSNHLKNVNYYVTSSQLHGYSTFNSWGIYRLDNIDEAIDPPATYCFIGGLPSGDAHNNIDGLRYSGSLQEVRYHFGELLSHETLIKHALEPFMYSGNSLSSSYENVILRLPLGSNDKRDSSSFHPNIDVNYLNVNTPEIIKNGDFELSREDDSSKARHWKTGNTAFADPPSYTTFNNKKGFRFITNEDNDNINIRQALGNDAVLNKQYTLSYNILDSNNDFGLMIEHQRINSQDQFTQLDTTVGQHTVTFTLTKESSDIPTFLIKRSHSNTNNKNIFITDISLKAVSTLESDMTTQMWEEVIETHHLPTPDTVGISTTSEKVRIDTGTIDDNWLSYNKKTETSTQDRQPLDYPDLGVFFSPTDEINEDILYTLGSFRLDDYIGSPLPSAQSASVYEDLSTIKDIYFKKVKRRYNYWDYVKLIQYIDHTLFKIIEQWVPSKANLKTGLVVEPHYLERTKFKREIPTTGVGQSMKNNSYQTFEFQIDPEKQFSLEGSSVIVNNNLSQITGSNGQRQETGTNGLIDINKTYKLAGSSNFSGNVSNGRVSSRYYRLLYDGKEKIF